CSSDLGDVLSPGTVIISAGANCIDINKVVEPVLKKSDANIYYINMSADTHQIGGSSFAQILGKLGNTAPTVVDSENFKNAFNVMQNLILDGKIQAGHDIGSGGLITTLLEMCFADTNLGAEINLSSIGEIDIVKLLFAENIGIVFQADPAIEACLKSENITFYNIGRVSETATMNIVSTDFELQLDIAEMRDIWF